MPLMLIATALTLLFGVVAWLALALYGILLPAEIARGMPAASRATLGIGLPFPWHALPWQVAGVITLVWAWIGAVRVRSAPDDRLVERRLLAHVMIVLSLLCLLGVAMALPLIDVVHVIR